MKTVTLSSFRWTDTHAHKSLKCPKNVRMCFTSLMYNRISDIGPLDTRTRLPFRHINMPVECSAGCGRRPILKRPKTGQALCKECFYWTFETEIHYTIVRAGLFRKGNLDFFCLVRRLADVCV